MDQSITLEHLNDRLFHIEKELDNVLHEMRLLREQRWQVPGAPATSWRVTIAWTDREILKNFFSNLFATWSIHGAPVGYQSLQQNMAQAGLETNELSRSIIEAREE